MEVNAKPVLSPVSDMTGRQEIVEASKMFLKKMAALVSKNVIAGLYFPEFFLYKYSLCI